MQQMRTSHLAISGRIDRTTTRSLAFRLHAHAGQTVGDVIVDCSAMSYIDSDGLRSLVEASKGLAAQNRALVLTGLQPGCRQAIEISGLAAQFGLTQDA
jgi:anti-anti-sigma factor